MRKRFICILFIIVGIQVQAQSNIKVGEKSPAINITDWIINVPQIKSLKGKNIVLEFWATWCGPCIEAVPHLNNLQSKYTDQNVYFISITDESIEKVNRILKRVDFKSIVVSDQTKKTQVLFGDGKNGLNYYPLTVLIDKYGIVNWIGEPGILNETVMNSFLKINNPISLPGLSAKENMTEQIEVIEEDKRLDGLLTDKDLMYCLEIRKSKMKESGMTNVENKTIIYSATSFLDIYSNLLDIDKKNILIPEHIASEKFDMIYKNNYAKKEDIVKLDHDLLYILGLQKKTEKTACSVLSFSINDSTLLEKALNKNFSSKSDAGDKVIFSNYSVPDLIKSLNSYSTGRLVFDGNNNERFDFIIDIKSTDALIYSLNTYGLKMQTQNRNIEMIKLEPKE